MLVATLLLGGCQITIDPVFDDYYGLKATFTVSPTVLSEDPFDDYEPAMAPDEDE